jgi:hypothetical protein
MRTGKYVNILVTGSQCTDEKVVVVVKVLESMRHCVGPASRGLGVLSVSPPAAFDSFSTLLFFFSLLSVVNSN